MPLDTTELPKLEIQAYIHCGKCLEDKADNVSPQEWQTLEVGWTVQGLQIWCRRHHCNVMHMDFEGQQHPADTRA